MPKLKIQWMKSSPQYSEFVLSYNWAISITTVTLTEKVSVQSLQVKTLNLTKSFSIHNIPDTMENLGHIDGSHTHLNLTDNHELSYFLWNFPCSVQFLRYYNKDRLFEDTVQLFRPIPRALLVSRLAFVCSSICALKHTKSVEPQSLFIVILFYEYTVNYSYFQG